MKVMISKVESDIQAFNVELEKFASRWHQLKPKDDIAMGGDKATAANAIASLKERQEEFNEIVTAANKLRCVQSYLVIKDRPSKLITGLQLQHNVLLSVSTFTAHTHTHTTCTDLTVSILGCRPQSS